MSTVDASIEKINDFTTDTINDKFYNYISKVSLQENNKAVEKLTNNDNIHHEIISEIEEAETRKIANEENMKEMQKGPWKFMTGSLNSVPEIHTDRANGNHELVLILPDSGKLYEGVLAYSAATDVQPAFLYGPVNITAKKGQLISSMDGNKWYAVSSKEANQKMGTWQFAGNILVIHSPLENLFSVNYTVIYREVETSKNAKIDTVQSIPIPLQNNNASSNNNEQVAMLLPPSDNHHSEHYLILHLKIYN